MDDLTSHMLRENGGWGQLFGRILTLLLVLLLPAGCGSPAAEAIATPPVSLLPATPTPAPTPTLAPERPSWSGGDPFIPEVGNSDIDVHHYDLTIALDPASPTVTGTTTIALAVTRDNVREIALDLVGFDVSRVTMNGLPVPFVRQNDKLVITSPLPLAAGWRANLVIDYAGAPVQEQSPYNFLVEYLGLRYPGDGTVFAVAQPDGSRYWFPCNDTLRDEARFRVSVITPPGLTGVANGTLVEQGTTPGGNSRFVWQHDTPMAPYLAMVAVGPFQRIDGQASNGIPIQHFVLPGYEALFGNSAAITAEAIDWLSTFLGPYPFESFGFVTVEMPHLSMETQTRALLSTSALDEPTMVHELSHMWFGNWVGLTSWSEMWRNEGFATYMEYLWATRNNPADLDWRMAQLENSVIARGGSILLGSTAPDQLFSFVNYHQGAVVVHKLHREMGDEAFFRGLRTYMARYGGGAASDAEFRAVMEEAAGRPLDDFWRAWFAN